MADLNNILAVIDRGLDRSVDRLFELARIESISTDPAHKQDCRKAAIWLAEALHQLGFSASARDTSGHPIVIAHYEPAGRGKAGPRVLFYGHYDVQPADPDRKSTRLNSSHLVISYA